MDTLDSINRQGRGQVIFAGQLRGDQWKMNRQHLSPCYTTRWDELPIVRC